MKGAGFREAEPPGYLELTDRKFSPRPSNWHATGYVVSMTTPTDQDRKPTESSLFEDLAQPSEAQMQEARTKATSKLSQGSPRLLQANRKQVELRASDLESLLPEDHGARLV